MNLVNINSRRAHQSGVVTLPMQNRLGANRIKLRPQTLGNDILSRSRLLARLNARRPLTLVEAPAGYGKTTLIVDWLSQLNVPYAWLSLDEYDNSLTTFLGYLLSAVQTLFPRACRETMALLNTGTSPPDSVYASTLAGEIEQLDAPFILVLDEYHSIKNLTIHRLMAELLTYQPNNLEIVLITRHEPPLPLPAMRARNRLTEIRTRELRFSRDECRSFLELTGGHAFAQEQIASFDEVFEGWIAGLRMATLLLQQEGETSGATLALDGSSRYAAEYLTQEVINNLPAASREFLIVTSHAEQVTAPLAAAMMDHRISVEESDALLQTLAKSNLFVFPVHGEDVWYRYHHLFRRALNHIAQLEHSRAEIATFYHRASNHLVTKGDLDSAIVCAVRSGDINAVASIVRDYRHLIMDHWHWSTIENWRRLLPRSMVDAHPQLLVLDAWHYSHLGYINDLTSVLAEMEKLLANFSLPEDEARSLRAEVNVMTAQCAYWTSDGNVCAEWAQKALDDCPMDHAFNRVFAWLFHTTGLENAGRCEETDASIAAAMSETTLHRGTVYPVHACTIPSYIYWHRADMVRLDEIANKMLPLAQSQSHLEGVAWATFFRGCARYQRNDLAGAERDFSTLLELSYIAHPLAFSQAHVALAATYQAQGRYEAAYSTAVEGWEFFAQSPYAIAAARAEGMMAFLAFRQGNSEQAMQWLSRPMRVPLDTPLPFFNSPVLGRVAVLLALETEESRSEAAELLEEFHNSVRNLHSPRFLIEVLAMRALLLTQQGNRTEALESMEQAVQLTVQGDAIRTLADLDFLIGPILDELAETSPARNQIHRIRRAAQVFRQDLPGRRAVTVETGATGMAPAPARNLQTSALIESLTYREMDVLLMLVERPTNKEIARELNISAGTVKRHMVNIFQKLNVENRRQAVAQARQLGILPSKD